MSNFGVITRIQLQSDSRENILVDVNLGPHTEREGIPFRTPGSNVWFIPSVGEGVEVSEYAHEQYIAHSPVSPESKLPTDAEEGDIVINKDNGTTIVVSDDGDITIDAAGDINLNAENLFYDGDRLATENHTHDYDDSTIEDTSDGSGTESTTTKTTGSPDEGSLT